MSNRFDRSKTEESSRVSLFIFKVGVESRINAPSTFLTLLMINSALTVHIHNYARLTLNLSLSHTNRLLFFFKIEFQTFFIFKTTYSSEQIEENECIY